MTVGTMRSIDRFLGVPLCWLTAALLSIHRPNKRIPPHREIRAILVMKFFGIGSILLSFPFLSALQRHLPEARIVYLTFSSNSDMLDKLPFTLEKLTISTSSLRKFITDTLVVLKTFRQHPINIVFDLEFFSKFSTLVSVLSRAPVRIGYGLPTRWRLGNLTHPVPLDRSKHVSQVFMRQLGEIGIDANETIGLPTLAATELEHATLERKLHLARSGSEIICVNINAGETSLERRWEPGRFMEVVKTLIRRNPGTRIIFTGNANEKYYVSQTMSDYSEVRDHVYNCAGELTIGELIALLERSSLLLTNDSGPMHIASAVGTPVVALFGPESPDFYGPLGSSRIVYKRLPCSPCLNIYNAKLFVCPYDARCMKDISITDVETCIKSLIPAELSPRH